MREGSNALGPCSHVGDPEGTAAPASHQPISGCCDHLDVNQWMQILALSHSQFLSVYLINTDFK